MREQLEAAVSETEAALLQLTRDRLLRQLDEQEAASQQPAEPGEPAAEGGGWAAGQRCIFRSTDGRHYLGTVERLESGTASVRYVAPTRQHQLVAVTLPVAALAAPRGQAQLAMHNLDVGARVVLCPPQAELWVGAEVVSLDPAEGLVAAVTEEVWQGGGAGSASLAWLA